jgi:hypothetical protein
MDAGGRRKQSASKDSILPGLKFSCHLTDRDSIQAGFIDIYYQTPPD